MNKIALTSALLTSAACCVGAAPTENPNIILINIDDLGWTDFSYMGSKYYETPHIDQLFEHSIYFSNAYSGGSNSAPSRACLMTGQYTPRHGIFTVNNSDRGKSHLRKLIPIPNKTSLPDGHQTLSRILKDNGYTTFHVGKWHITGNPLDCGFDVNIGGNHAGHPKSYFSPYKNADLPNGKDGEFLTDRLAKEAVALIDGTSKDKPFFLYYAPYAVHPPLQAKAELIKKYEAKTGDKQHNHPVFAAMIESMDESVGQILETVRKKGIEENTLIIFTNDNGGIYNLSKQWPLRAGKGSFYEGGIRVPILVYQKGRFDKKQEISTPVMQMDIAPTLLEMLDVKTDQYLLDGKSLCKLLKNGKDKKLEERSIYWHFPGYLENGIAESTDPLFRSRPVSVIRKGNWKLIENYETGKFELYNLKDDVSEKTNLVEANPKKVAELKKELYKWKENVKAPIPTELNPEYTGDLR